MQVQVENEPAVQQALDRLVELGEAVALARLLACGGTIAMTADQLNAALHGPLRTLAGVGPGDDAESLKVGYARVRSQQVAILAKHLTAAKRHAWARALSDAHAEAAVDAVRGEYIATGQHGPLLDVLVAEDVRRTRAEGVD